MHIFASTTAYARSEAKQNQLLSQAWSAKRYQLFIINWTPNNSIVKHTKWWFIERLLGRRYVHSSLVIAKVPPLHTEAKMDLSPEGKILMGPSQFHYFSFPDGNRINAYVPDGTKQRKVLFEAIRITELISDNQLSDFFHALEHRGYYLPPKWRKPYKSDDLVEQFKAITGDQYKAIKREWKSLGIFGQATILPSIEELLAPYSISLPSDDIKLVDEYIQVVRKLPKYRERYNMHNNNCVHSIYFALSQLYPPEKLKTLGKQENLSSQTLIRRLKKMFPGSTMMRASKVKHGWQLSEVDHFIGQGYRPYLWGGLVLATVSVALMPAALRLR